MHNILTNEKEDILSIQDNENLLDFLEKKGYAVSYQCRSGYCGACRITKLSGEVSYEKTPLAYIGASEILPCCCQVKTTLVLDIDKKTHQQCTENHDNDLFQ